MLTPEEIEAQIRADHPEFVVHEDGEDHTISPESDSERYEEMVMERVEWQLEQQERDAEIAAKQDVRRLITTGLPLLEANLETLRGTGAVSGAESRRMLGDVTKAAIEIIHGLQSLNLLEE